MNPSKYDLIKCNTDSQFEERQHETASVSTVAHSVPDCLNSAELKTNKFMICII